MRRCVLVRISSTLLKGLPGLAAAAAAGRASSSRASGGGGGSPPDLGSPSDAAAAVVSVLWVLGRYRLNLQEHGEAAVEAVADALAGLTGAWSMMPSSSSAPVTPPSPSSSSPLGPEASVDASTSLGLVHAKQLATALADLELQPDVRDSAHFNIPHRDTHFIAPDQMA